MRVVPTACLMLVAAACGGPDEHAEPPDAAVADAAPDAAEPDAHPGYLVGGVALGMRAEVTLRLATPTGEQVAAVASDGTFAFPEALADGASFAVTVDGAPPCVLSGATGLVAGGDVTTIELVCEGVTELADVSFSLPVVLSPGFAPALLGYDGRWPLLADGVTTFALTPEAAFPARTTITVEGAITTSGQPSAPLAIDAMPAAEATVVVTDPSGLARTYVFDLAQGLGQEAYVKASTVAGGDYFGISVDLDGDTMVVGAAGVELGGAVYVFERVGSTWSQTAVLRPATLDDGDGLGVSVALDGDWLVAGASFEDGAGGDPEDESVESSGAAYVFHRTAFGWVEDGYLKASNPDVYDAFGEAVAIDGDTVVVGTRYEQSAATGIDGDEDDDTIDLAGAAYVFRRDGGGWYQEAYLKASNTHDDLMFGSSVAISAETVAVGAPGEGNLIGPTEAYSGAVYIFMRDGAVWSQQALLKASDREIDDILGYAIALEGDRLVAVAPQADAAYVFGRTSGWSEESILPVSGYAWRVALHGDWICVGAGETGMLLANVAGTWVQRAQVTASNHESGDFFGSGIALDGDTLVIGAMHEESAATGIDGDQTDNSAPLAGAVYVFR